MSDGGPRATVSVIRGRSQAAILTGNSKAVGAPPSPSGMVFAVPLPNRGSLPPDLAGRGQRRLRQALSATPFPIDAKPEFIIIGAQKAGTSSLYSWLTSHPDVLAARNKELHHFDRHNEFEPIGPYLRSFPSELTLKALRMKRGRVVVTGEATPYYLFHPFAPGRVHYHLPDIKLVAILRDPVERAVSHYWMQANRGLEKLTLENALAAESDRIEPELNKVERGEEPGVELQLRSYLARGHYANQLERWFDLFPRSQLRVLQFELLVADPARVYREVLDYVGVDADAAPFPTFAPLRVGTKLATDQETIGRLREHFRAPNERLRALVGIDYNARWL